MSADEVSQLILEQISGRDTLPNSHGVDVHRCLVPPIKFDVIHRSVRQGEIHDSVETVWLVLEEKPRAKEGYKIVFTEQMGIFGLASPGFPSDQHPVLCGYYGDFPNNLASM